MAVAKASPKSTAAPKAATTTVVVAPKAAATRTTKSAKAADQRFQQAKRASILLKHVSDPTRLQVILILAEGERHVGALCAQLSQSQPAVSHHLALLRHGNIIAPRRQGKNNFYSLTDTGAELARVVKNLIA
ncbi:ArsR/SmtB family transcription factor [Paludisphaera borealis]|uniref:Biofilm growth-associated repressor n=1 Tax=Paludisphaera borealis TaxID=1387353 RepID=A0A1U7CU46_9BACT|nr:metalloregulator ArsR/SmtB family transcription factor [Paludisphaera borealis]APW62464.1 Biofilm growth-associated repressor [Paludisphaera borealis]